MVLQRRSLSRGLVCYTAIPHTFHTRIRTDDGTEAERMIRGRSCCPTTASMRDADGEAETAIEQIGPDCQSAISKTLVSFSYGDPENPQSFSKVLGAILLSYLALSDDLRRKRNTTLCLPAYSAS
jgi:hypothetical protein